jgi:hypothetical protein
VGCSGGEAEDEPDDSDSELLCSLSDIAFSDCNGCAPHPSRCEFEGRVVESVTDCGGPRKFRVLLIAQLCEEGWGGTVGEFFAAAECERGLP